MATILKNSLFNLCIAKIRICSLTVFNTGKILSLTTSRLILGSNSLGLRRFHLTRHVLGIEEFFPSGVLETNEPLPEEVLSGRSWKAAELRQKSNGDLHKLWYVLLKERNMLLSVQWEARRQEVVMPSPQRLHKVKKSMAMIKVVIGERQKAIEAIEKDIKERQSGQNLIKGDNEEQQGMLDEHKGTGKHLNQVPIAT